MFEFTCLTCGKVVQVEKECHVRTYCCIKCAAVDRERKHREIRAQFLDGECLYQPESIICENRDCANCGWNPAVAQARLDVIRERLEDGLELNANYDIDWIPVEDKLPRDGKQVMCYTKAGKVTLLQRKEDRWCSESNVQVTHWLPLPRPPEGMKDAPCKDCEIRFPSCHGRCPKDKSPEYDYYGYEAWLKDVHRARAVERERKLQEREAFIRSEQCGWINGRRKY